MLISAKELYLVTWITEKSDDYIEAGNDWTGIVSVANSCAPVRRSRPQYQLKRRWEQLQEWLFHTRLRLGCYPGGSPDLDHLFCLRANQKLTADSRMHPQQTLLYRLPTLASPVSSATILNMAIVFSQRTNTVTFVTWLYFVSDASANSSLKLDLQTTLASIKTSTKHQLLTEIILNAHHAGLWTTSWQFLISINGFF